MNSAGELTHPIDFIDVESALADTSADLDIPVLRYFAVHKVSACEIDETLCWLMVLFLKRYIRAA